jgi:hypothetical protein
MSRTSPWDPWQGFPHPQSGRGRLIKRGGKTGGRWARRDAIGAIRNSTMAGMNLRMPQCSHELPGGLIIFSVFDGMNFRFMPLQLFERLACRLICRRGDSLVKIKLRLNKPLFMRGMANKVRVIVRLTN